MTTIADWIRPNYLELEVQKLFTSPQMSDIVQGCANLSEWTHVITGNKQAEELGAKFQVFDKFYGVPGAFEKAGKLKASWERWQAGGEGLPVVENGLLFGNQVAKASLFFDAISIAPLHEGIKAASGTFWGTIAVLDSIQVWKNIDNVSTLNSEIKATTDGAKKEIQEHRYQIALLSIVKSVNSIAQSLIALVSIFFASLAFGVIFEPVVFLALTSSWLTLNFGIHFYDKIVDHWDAMRLAHPTVQQALAKA